MTQEHKALVYDMIIDHLNTAKNDPRKREKLRALTALNQIKKWGENAKLLLTN